MKWLIFRTAAIRERDSRIESLSNLAENYRKEAVRLECGWNGAAKAFREKDAELLSAKNVAADLKSENATLTGKLSDALDELAEAKHGLADAKNEIAKLKQQLFCICDLVKGVNKKSWEVHDAANYARKIADEYMGVRAKGGVMDLGRILGSPLTNSATIVKGDGDDE